MSLQALSHHVLSVHRRAAASPETLRAALARTDQVTPALISAALDLAVARCGAPNRVEQASRVRRLIDAEAWTDAALALAGLDHRRVVRQIALDDGAWHCVIGTHAMVPDWLDDTVVVSHAVLPLAILGAVLDALMADAAAAPQVTSVPRTRGGIGDAATSVCCDNFA